MLESEKLFIRSIVEKIEKLESDKDILAQHIRDIYSEVKDQGYDVKVLKKVIKLRKIDQGKLEEEQELIDLYNHAIITAKNNIQNAS